MNNYDIRFCKCGRIHAIPYSDLWDYMAEDYENRRVIHVCTHCGTVRKMWLDKYEDGLAVNSHETAGSRQTFTNVSKVITGNGLEVFTTSGEVANIYCNGYFINRGGWNRHAYDYPTLQEAYNSKADWISVDVEALEKEVELECGEDADNVLNAIKKRNIKIDWNSKKKGENNAGA